MKPANWGPEFVKINSLWKRDTKGKILEGDFSTPEIEFLFHAKWIWTEKIDGTNIRLHWDGQGDSTIEIGGRTNNAQLPAPLVAELTPRLDVHMWAKVFPDTTDVTLYGEGYGAGIQKGGGNYRRTQDFILFDVLVGKWWLQREDVEDVASKLGFDIVPLWQGPLSPSSAWDMLKSGRVRSSRWPGVPIEGLVGRPQVELFDRSGRRIITKMKYKDLETK